MEYPYNGVILDANSKTTKIIGDKIMNITSKEARELYKQGAMAREIALRAYSMEEIINDYSLITTLPTETTCTTAELYAKLKLYHNQLLK